MPKLPKSLTKKLTRKALKNAKVAVVADASSSSSSSSKKIKDSIIKVEPLHFSSSAKSKAKSKSKRKKKAKTEAESKAKAKQDTPQALVAKHQQARKSKVSRALPISKAKAKTKAKPKSKGKGKGVKLANALQRTLLIHSFPAAQTSIYHLEEYFGKISSSVRVVMFSEECEEKSIELAVASAGREDDKRVPFAYAIFPSKRMADLANKRLSGKPLRLDAVAGDGEDDGAGGEKRHEKKKKKQKSRGRKRKKKWPVQVFKCSPHACLRYELKDKTKCVCFSNVDKEHTIGRDHIRQLIRKHLAGCEVVAIVKEYRQYIVQLPDVHKATMAVYLLSGRKVSGRPLFVHWCDGDAVMQKKAQARQARREQRRAGSAAGAKLVMRMSGAAIGGEVDSDEEGETEKDLRLMKGDVSMSGALHKLLS